MNTEKQKTNIAKLRLPEEIITLARENGIDLSVNNELLDELKKVQKGVEVPPEAFKLISEFIFHFYKIKDKWVEGNENQ